MRKNIFTLTGLEDASAVLGVACFPDIQATPNFNK
jgi:hypothetical protein